MKRPWVTLTKKIDYQHPYWKVRKDKVVKPNGKKGYYYHVVQNDYVIIVPLTADKKGSYIIRQWRYAVEKNSWEFAAGSIENGETPQQAAKRELFEETGIKAKKWKKVKYIKVDNGLTGQGFYVFICSDLSFGKPTLEEGELDMIMNKFTFKQIDKMIDKGKIFESPMLATMYVVKKYLKI